MFTEDKERDLGWQAQRCIGAAPEWSLSKDVECPHVIRGQEWPNYWGTCGWREAWRTSWYGQATLVSQKMRSAARLLESLRRMDPWCETCQTFWSQQSSTWATIKLSGDTEESFLHPSTTLKYGYDLQEMADLKDSVGIIANDEDMQTEAANFIKLKEKEWRYWITSLAHEVISERNFSKTVKLPTPDDIKKLSDYLKSEMSKAKLAATKEAFRRAVELVQVRLVTYNKKCPES